MFDFGAISSVAETLETGVRDIDSRLQSIENMHRRILGCLLLLVAQGEGTHLSPAQLRTISDDAMQFVRPASNSVPWNAEDHDAREGRPASDGDHYAGRDAP